MTETVASFLLHLAVAKGVPVRASRRVADAYAPLGEPIAFHGRRRGLSQVKLAGLVGRSESWPSQVERGVRSAGAFDWHRGHAERS